MGRARCGRAAEGRARRQGKDGARGPRAGRTRAGGAGWGEGRTGRGRRRAGAALPRAVPAEGGGRASPAQRPLHARVGGAARLGRPLAGQAQVLLQAAVGVQRHGGRAGGGRARGGAALMLQGDGLGPLPHPAARRAGRRRRPLASPAARARRSRRGSRELPPPGASQHQAAQPRYGRRQGPVGRAGQSAPGSRRPHPAALLPVLREARPACPAPAGGHLGEGRAKPRGASRPGRGRAAEGRCARVAGRDPPLCGAQRGARNRGGRGPPLVPTRGPVPEAPDVCLGR